MIVFTCCDTFDDMMTCIYDAWAARLGHSNIRLQTEPIGNFELFCEYRHIDADKEKVKKSSALFKIKYVRRLFMMSIPHLFLMKVINWILFIVS